MENLENTRNIKLPDEWKILLVDDVDKVHNSLKLRHKYSKIEGAGLKFFDAYNPEEAIKILTENRDIAVVILDIVMADQEPGGYKVVKFIREELGDTAIRIIVRTGQAGLHPERLVVEKHNIDNYINKLNDTKEKLEAALITAMRAYIEIKVRDAQNEMLRNILSDEI
jgi:diguanylate cyclase